MFAAIDNGDILSEEMHFRLIEPAIMRGACALFVLQFISFCEARAFRGRALEIFGKQASDYAIVDADTLGPLAFLSSADAQ